MESAMLTSIENYIFSKMDSLLYILVKKVLVCDKKHSKLLYFVIYICKIL
jgi:hypothetical protein